MGRPKKFDPEEALSAAAQIFWTRGFHETSIRDLEEGLSIGRKSLYDTFGDKKTLFVAVLDRYLELPIPIASPDASWPEIVAMFHAGPPYDPRLRSCLFVNTIQEFGREKDREVAARINLHVERLETLFHVALERAVDAGQIPACDLDAASRYLCTGLLGLSVRSKAGLELDALRDVADQILASIAAPA